MWKPANTIHWQSEALCAKPQNSHTLDWFFSSEFSEKYAAKNLCFQCPVRKNCLQWALEHRQIWGVWGGRDEIDIRRTLSVSYLGEETRRRRYPNCPYCAARPNRLETAIVDLESTGRWNTAKIVYCLDCGFSWKSRTSANAVEAYKVDRAERSERQRRERERQKRAKEKEKAKQMKLSKRSSSAKLDSQSQ